MLTHYFGQHRELIIPASDSQSLQTQSVIETKNTTEGVIHLAQTVTLILGDFITFTKNKKTNKTNNTDNNLP